MRAWLLPERLNELATRCSRKPRLTMCFNDAAKQRLPRQHNRLSAHLPVQWCQSAAVASRLTANQQTASLCHLFHCRIVTNYATLRDSLYPAPLCTLPACTQDTPSQHKRGNRWRSGSTRALATASSGTACWPASCSAPSSWAPTPSRKPCKR